jgi:hypothetical protein
MTDWIPEVSVINEERQLILELIKLCKKEMTENRARILALQMLANQGQSALAIQIANAIQEQKGSVQEDVDVLFRRVESALARGEDHRPSLRDLLSKYQ